MPLILYHAIGSSAFAPLVALEEVAASFELRMLDLARGDQRDPRFLAVNPHGRVPALEADGQPITEVIAVLTYIAATYPGRKLLPTAPQALAAAMQFMSWIASSVHVALAQIRRPARFLDGETGRPELAETGRRRFAAALSEIETRAAAAPWLSGEAFGALDAYALVVGRWAEGLGFDPNTYPAFRDLALRAYERQGVRQALAREQQTPKFFDQTETANARS